MDQVYAQLVTAGPLGLFISWLMWERQRNDKQKAEERTRRDQLDKERIDTDKQLAASLATLATLIQGAVR